MALETGLWQAQLRDILPLHFELGGGVWQRLLPESDRDDLRRARKTILQTGRREQGRHGSYNDLVTGFLDHVKHEPFNGDWKVVDSKIPDPTRCSAPEGVEVKMGNTTGNNGWQSHMITFEGPDNGSGRRVRLSRPGTGDRRWSNSGVTGLATTRQQSVVVNPLGEVVDLATGLPIGEIQAMPAESMSDVILSLTMKSDQSVVENALIQLSRYFLNIVRRLGRVSSSSGLPIELSGSALRDFMDLLYEKVVHEGMVGKEALAEAQYRLMACFCIDPKNFMYYAQSSEINMGLLFPFFGPRLSYGLHDLIPDRDQVREPELLERAIEIAGGAYYDPNISPLANLARWFTPQAYHQFYREFEDA